MQNAIIPTQAPSSKFSGKLLGVTRGRIVSPMRALVYGAEGVGKTTLAAGIEDVIFLCKESGTEQHDIARLKEPTHWRDAPADSDGVHRDVFWLTNMLRFGDHNYKALAIDTVDWIEPILFKYVCESGPKKANNIVLAYGGFGKGFDVAVDEWRAWISLLDALRKERNMHIVLLAHSHVKTFNNPEGENYDRYQLKMHEKGAGVLKEWCDAVLFAHQEVFAGEKKTASDDRPKMFGVGSMSRHLFTQRRPAWDAKNRFNLPDKIPMSWSGFMAHVKANSPETVDAIIKQINEQTAFLSVENQEEVKIALERANRDFEKLQVIINWIHSNQQPEEVK